MEYITEYVRFQGRRGRVHRMIQPAIRIEAQEDKHGHGEFRFYRGKKLEGILYSDEPIKLCQEHNNFFMDWDDEAECMVIQHGIKKLLELPQWKAIKHEQVYEEEFGTTYARELWEAFQHMGFKVVG